MKVKVKGSVLGNEHFAFFTLLSPLFVPAPISFVSNLVPSTYGHPANHQAHNYLFPRTDPFTGLFFGGKLPQFFGPTTTTTDVAEFVDQTWVCGMYQYPGGCDPNWTYSFAVRAAMGAYPGMVSGIPLDYGYDQCVYNAGQDERLRVGDTSGVHDN